ncbi:MAG: LicD family protein [Dehalococcoidales bacterium]
MEINNSADEAALKRSMETLETIDVTAAEKFLKEIKQILDNLGITFFLRKGTCLGAVRDSKLIPWDDDVDIGSVLGYNGLTEKSIDQVIAALRDNGYLINIDHLDYAIYVVALKSSIRTDWMVQRIIDDSTFHWPGVRMPARLFTHTEEIDFLGEKFRVPSPVEEYLGLMYGPEWKVPKRAGFYEKDVLAQIPADSLPGHAGKLKKFIINYLMPWLSTSLKVLDSEGKPVTGARITVAGLGNSVTDSKGYARLYIPYDFTYSLTIRYDEHEEVLYEENITPRKRYLYRADAQSSSGRNFILIPENQP